MEKEKTVVKDPVWQHYMELVRKEMIPYQWEVLNDNIDISIEKERDDDSIPSEKSHAIENFKIAAGMSEGEHYGWVFQDSDVYKWLEAVSYSLESRWDEDLKTLADGVVDLIGKAQQADGYINTYYTIKKPGRRYTDLVGSHELYCAGHLLEALTAYNKVSGSKKAMSIALKLADHIDAFFGPEDGKIHAADGHEEVEIGLMKLYHVTGEERYLKLAEYFLNIRGSSPEVYKKQQEENREDVVFGISNGPNKYNQTHLPVEKQDTAEGHAVRLVYMCTAMADVAAETGDEELLRACGRIWRNIADRRMYITGGIGSTVQGEAFTLDNDLPNDTMYCETCASIGLVFFAKQMLKLERDAEYADVMERALYNTVLSGMALDGKHFFYVNPLEVVPEKGKKDPTKSHVKSVRPQWLGCACCPPNLARLVASIGDYIYSVFDDNTVLVNLFIRSEMICEVGGKDVKISLDADYPRSGRINISIENNSGTAISLGIRIPFWTDSVKGSVDGSETVTDTDGGYWYISVPGGTHKAELDIEIKPKRWYANVNVSEDIHKVAVARGPQVYCIEGADNGEDLHTLSLKKTGELKNEWKEDLLNGINVIEGEGVRCKEVPAKDGKKMLYSDRKPYEEIPQKITFIPYHTWGNRGENEMRVWLYESE
ncbi:MAG: glycoside hydrolase family 127 protein [Lachnospiraceae bacterium]|nr:glycoside hydrolase family 127 protein [Lachnospiraceae bacterium]